MSTPISPSYRNRIAYHSVLLGIFALFASTGLMMSYFATKDDISARLKEDLQLTLGKVIPEEIHDNDLADDRVQINFETGSKNAPKVLYIARKNHQVVGTAFQIIAPNGYSGPILLMLGVGINGNILGVRVIAHKETPGLGDKIEVEKDNWILGFNNLSLDNTAQQDWHVRKDGGRFDAFSGATITPRAVIYAVHDGLKFFNQHKQAIISLANEKQELL